MARGRLRIYLGAAPGVGKTYALLNEGWRRRERGTDVVIGYVECHDRALTADQLRDLEIIPRRRLEHRGATFEEMDLDAVLARQPSVVLVDELAHTNIPGSTHEKRWQDIECLLDAGIDVISTVNIQHLESLNDVVEAVTGIRQHETVPDEIVRSAEQVELVDMTAEAIRRRMAHGNIYAPDKIDAALANYFRPGNLNALRELALLWVADRVDDVLADYRARHNIDTPWETRERVVVAVADDSCGDQLIRRAARMAQRSHAELHGIHVTRGDGRSTTDTSHLAGHRRLIEDLGGTFNEIVADDIAGAVLDFARSVDATQLVIGASTHPRWRNLFHGSFTRDLIRRSGDIDVHVISTHSDQPPPQTQRRIQRPAATHSALGTRRQLAGWVTATIGTLTTTVILAHTRGTFDQGSQLLLFLTVVVTAAAIGGLGPAVAAAVLASAALNWYFTEPLYTWTIHEAADVVALAIFLTMGIAVGTLVTALATRTLEATRGRAEAEALARVAGAGTSQEDPLTAMLEQFRRSIAAAGVAVIDARTDDTLAVGDPIDPDTAHHIPLSNAELLLPSSPTPDSARIIDVFAHQLDTALDRRRLAEEAAHAEVIARADALRVALLRAVSHDLRTPLASIKASVTSLLDAEIQFDETDRTALLETIADEADRLNNLIANLLDASRLEAGAVQPALTEVALDEIVPAALRALNTPSDRLEIDIAPTLPPAVADPGLLERAVANIVTNALKASPDRPVRIAASAHLDEIQLRVIDHGPGVPQHLRTTMFEPFQRLGDTASSDGVGLGLSVARGLIEAMNGTLTTEETPGGGLTMVATLTHTGPSHG